MASISEVAIGVRRNPHEALRTALSRLNEPLVPPRNVQRVVIKPSIYDPDLPGNTNVNVVRSVVHMFRSIGPICVVESDNPLRMAKDAFARCGYLELEDEGAELLNLSDSELTSIKFAGHFFQSRKMPGILHDNIFLINIATLKAEPEICTVGAGIKNLFGLLPELDKSIYHTSIDHVLMDLLDAYRPNLTVIDLTEVVIGSRTEGRTKQIGGVVVGLDPVAVDSFCSSLLGIDPLKVNYLRIATSLGMGEVLSDRILVRGTEHQKEELSRILNK
ncbi:MAG: DUF362 domain-containing protein [Candidatus Thorarchaeota archaeon SMTZ1-45]|nr:MAG: hypothetical protein AM325_10785 [Candidatus Thorarchaeota archaeon SMTZ1-45]